MRSVIPADVSARDGASVTFSHASPALQGQHAAWEVTWILALVLHQLKCLLSPHHQHLCGATNCTVIAQVSPGTPLGAGEAALLAAKQLVNGEDAARGGKGPGCLSVLAGQAAAGSSTFFLRNTAPTAGLRRQESLLAPKSAGDGSKIKGCQTQGEGERGKYSFDQP